MQKPKETVVVMLSKDTLFVQGEAVATLDQVRNSTELIIAPLRDALKRPTLVGQAMTEKEIAEREITLMADKTIPYEVLKKVMSTCTDADYGKISFALVQKEKAVDMALLRHSL
jgi:biopolymer transport protein ExbD